MNDEIRTELIKHVACLESYRWYELFFGKYRIVRKLSKCFWIKIDHKDHEWIKFNKAYFKKMKFPDDIKILVEDYKGDKNEQ